MSHQYHVFNKNKKAGARSCPKTQWSYCPTNSSFETKTVLCDHIIAHIPRLKLETAKNRDKKLNHLLTTIVFWNQISTVWSYRCIYSTFETKTAKKQDLKLVRPYCRTKLSRCKPNTARSAIKISSQNCATIFSHQFVFWNKNSSVRSYCCINSTFETKTAKKRDTKLVRPYCRTNSIFQTKTAMCDQDSRSKTVGPYCRAPFVLLKPIKYCAIIIVAPIPCLKIKQAKKRECETVVTKVSHQFHDCKQKQQGATNISSQNYATIFSHQFVLWNKNNAVWLYCRTNYTFGYLNSKKARYEIDATILSHHYATFSNKNKQGATKIVVPKLCDHIVAPIRILKQNHYCVIISSHRFHVRN